LNFQLYLLSQKYFDIISTFIYLTRRKSETRLDEYKRITSELLADKTYVWFVRLPHPVCNDYLQDKSISRGSGELTTYTSIVEATQEQYGLKLGGHHIWLHWQIPLVDGFESTSISTSTINKTFGGLSLEEYERRMQMVDDKLKKTGP